MILAVELFSLSETLALIAAIAALGAFLIAFWEARRNNNVIVRLKNVGAHCVRSFQKPAGDFHEFRVLIENRGLQLQDIHMELVFDAPDKMGSLYVPIPLGDHGEGLSSAFMRGMMAEFVLSVAGKEGVLLLTSLTDVKGQRPKLILYNNSFVACSFSMSGPFDRVKKAWNWISFKFMYERRMGEGKNGNGVFKLYHLPYFMIPSEQLQTFVDGVRAKLEPANEKAEVGTSSSKKSKPSVRIIRPD